MIKIKNLRKNQKDMIGIVLSYAYQNNGHINSDVVRKLVATVKPDLDSVTPEGNYRAFIAARFIIAALVGEGYIRYTNTKIGNTKDYILTWKFKRYFCRYFTKIEY